MAAAGKSALFDTWMLRESDLVQAAARAYGERLVAEQVRGVGSEAGRCAAGCEFSKNLRNGRFYLFIPAQLYTVKKL